MVLLPIFLLAFTGLFVLVIYRRQSGFGYAWLAGFISILMILVLAIVYRLRLPLSYTSTKWLRFIESAEAPQFIIDPVNWQYFIVIIFILMGVFLTAPARKTTHPLSWSGTLLFAGLSLGALFSANPLTLIMFWSAMDVFELVYVISAWSAGEKSRHRYVILFSLRVSAIVLFWWAYLQYILPNPLPDVWNLSQDVGGILLFGAIIRLLFSLHHISSAGLSEKQLGLRVVLDMLPAVSVFALLSRLQMIEFDITVRAIFLILAIIFGWFFSLRWAVCPTARKGESYWFNGFCMLAIGSAMNATGYSVSAWVIPFILAGVMLQLYTWVQKKYTWIFLLTAGLLICGLPYTAASGGWTALFNGRFAWAGVGFFFVVLFLGSGWLKFICAREDGKEFSERFVNVGYPLGLLVFPVGGVVAYILQPGSQPEMGMFIPGVVIFVLLAAGYAYYSRMIHSLSPFDVSGSVWGKRANKLMGLRVFHSSYQFSWVIDGIFSILRGAGTLVNATLRILDGDGGILWVLVIMVLMITLIKGLGVG